EIFWTNAFSSFKRLADIFPSPANRVALAAGMTLILCFGFFISYQHEQINRLETELTHFRGSDRPAVKNPVDTFVIFTGRFVSEALPIAAGEYAAHLVPEADKSEVRFIAGEFSEIGDRMEAFVRSLQGELKEDRVFQENDLVFRKMIVELPQNSDATLSLFLQGLEQEKEAQSPLDNMPVISLEIFILDRTF
ncbi:MAG: hypothetical protein GY801_22295, partial [bacterium]|nr:hypothetical protein [bacterium]